VIDVDAGALALHDLRRARRRNRLADVHWIDALYRVYIAAFVGVIFMFVVAGRLPSDQISAESAARFAVEGPAWLGAAFALALALGLRSGGRGGPLVLEAPVVVHELQAPVPRIDVLRGPAIKQLRFLAFAGAVAGAIVGGIASRRLPVNVFAAAACTAAAFACAAVLATGAAMVASGRRLAWWTANVLAVLVLTWSVLDIAAKVTTSPLTWLAQLAFWPLRFAALAILGVALALIVPTIGVLGLGNLSIEAARRRAGLVAQLRFAVTLQDIRTVVLLRRQLSQEKLRNRPWIRLGRARRMPPVWHRDWQSVLRFPATRLLRMGLLGVAAGLALGFAWRGAAPAVVVAGLALYLAAYDANEPLAQEVDHPTRWESYPEDAGKLLLNHLPAAVLVMVVISLVAAASALILVPATVVLHLTPVLIVPVALATAIAAAVSTAQGAPDVAHMMGLGPDMLGFVLLGRLILPPAIAVVALLPVLAAGSDPDALGTARVGNATSYALFAIFGAFLWLRYRKPKHL